MSNTAPAFRIAKAMLWSVVVLVVVYFSLVAYRRAAKARGVREAEQEATQIISRNLYVPADRVACEFVMVDDYMNYHSVFFEVRGVAAETLKTGLVDYKKESQEKQALRLHRTGIRELKRLKWGPLEKYSACPEYVGVWEKDYLVYLAVCGDTVSGYYENRYSEEPGPGPFR